ncbi:MULTISPECIES: hypothetical protein [unclassified Leptolyngbya]|uniref:hypothetical protein n=1 Tax=unclassified Leptolyngbya TaxID=2650499 RepID=UPI00168868CE|nr:MULTISPECIES: hypothetical protein [unclassified Leptolyngbya]MBD1910709.1 hypothetical protein [Leptolyngbya sp. FACHB-8]MBD2154306.1 hypothetical protein [Leptolyngbya sp. FACHB-16]
MNLPLNETRSIEIAQEIQSKASQSFDNAYRAALVLKGATYVQGFVAVAYGPSQPIEHAWLEMDESIIDPTLPHFNRATQDIHYFPAQHLSIKKLKAIIEESQEDYPEDDPLPIYGAAPYEYYGEVMLGGKDYLNAFQAAEAKCKELKSTRERN